jgi:uncharacterized membrane protein
MNWKFALWCASCLPASIAGAQGYSFTLLESSFPGSTARAVAHAISGNGQVIAGGDTRYWLGEQPVVWRREGGGWVRSALPVPPQGSGTPQNVGRVMSLSFTGDIAAGISGSTGFTNTPNYGRATRWQGVLTDSPTLQQLEPTIIQPSTVAGISADGSIIAYTVATCVPNPPFQGCWIDARVYRWNAATNTSEQFAPLGEPGMPGYSTLSLLSTQSVSADGNVIAMGSLPRDEDVPRRAVRGASGVLQELAPGPPWLNSYGVPNRAAHAISGDGTVAVGYAFDVNTSAARTRAMSWTSDGTATALPLLTRPTPGGGSNLAVDVSADGKIMVGSQHGQYPYPGAIEQVRTSRAVYWLADRPRLLSSVLAAEGVDLGGVVPALITGISDDGATLTGIALTSENPDSELVSFVATILPPGTCDDIDFNRDGNRFDPLDIDAFLSVFSEGPCLPAGANCRDIDFNNDGSLFDPEDIDAFLRVFSEGPCTL